MSDYIDFLAEKIGLHDAVVLRHDWYALFDAMERSAEKDWHAFLKKYPTLQHILTAKVNVKDITGSLIDVSRSL